MGILIVLTKEVCLVVLILIVLILAEYICLVLIVLGKDTSLIAVIVIPKNIIVRLNCVLIIGCKYVSWIAVCLVSAKNISSLLVVITGLIVNLLISYWINSTIVVLVVIGIWQAVIGILLNSVGLVLLNLVVSV
jgi:hypothetical protein